MFESDAALLSQNKAHTRTHKQTNTQKSNAINNERDLQLQPQRLARWRFIPHFTRGGLPQQPPRLATAQKENCYPVLFLGLGDASAAVTCQLTLL